MKCSGFKISALFQLGIDEFSNVVSDRYTAKKSNMFNSRTKTNLTEEAIQAKARARSETKANRSINLMVISISFYYVIGTVPYSTMLILSKFMPIDGMLQTYILVALYFCHGGSIFICYGFNKLFRQTLNGYLKFFLFRKWRSEA